MALQGAGTEADPWLIGTINDMALVLRDSTSRGYYRIVADIYSDATYKSIAAIASQSVADGYAPKVIDGNGYGVNIYSGGTGLFVCFAAGIHFKNIKIKLMLSDASSASGTHYLYPFYRCSFDDSLLQINIFNAYGMTTSIVFPHIPSSVSELIPPSFSRVVMLGYAGSGYSIGFNISSVLGTVVADDAYAYSTASVGAGVTKLTQNPTLAMLDGLSGSAFSDAGWWQDGINLLPLQSESVALTLQTMIEGANASRRLWLESERYTRYLGESDANGTAQFIARIRRRSGFSILAAEDFGTDDLRADKAISAGYWYLPPADNGYVYQADIAGRITSLAGVTFADLPVVVDGITFTPRPRYAPVMSDRRSVARNGGTQVITLDNAAGGGGPVIEGDPAFLEGSVEEVHPMTGLRRALANCEVVAFEKRGSDYVAMGSTYSDGIGGFRLETQVYGGGDVFAFAADFPGVIFQPGVTLNLGDRIRPALANGYVYEIVQAGTAGATEPVWWPDQGDGTEGAIGTATARARPYYQPVGHGPLKMTLM